MYIHTVRPGETLTAIAGNYGVAAGLVARVNGLQRPYRLAVGQSLLILTPARLHTVQPGETLWTIAGRYGVPALELLRNNPNLEGRAALYPGQVLVIAWTDAPTMSIDVNGYVYPYVDEAVLRGILPYTTFLTPFTYGISAEGGLVPLEDARLVALAGQYGVAAWLHLSTLTESGTFSNDRAALILTNPAAQENLAQLAVDRAVAGGYRGIDMDFEYIYPEQAAQYAEFAGRLRRRANAQGLELIIALAPKSSAGQAGLLYEGHNYRLLGQNADAVLLMTYEWGYTYGPAMAVAPVGAVREVLDYAVTEIPPEKIFMGFPNYAYDFAHPYVAGVSRARSLSNPGAVALAVEVGAEIHYDEAAETPYFYYTDGDGVVHEVWFEDARSSLAKFRLVAEYGFRGLGYWNFMRPFPANFSLLNAMFRIRSGAGL